jgi:hypothetical protein
MKFTTREDIDLPIGEAFAAVADFDYLERQILRRGIEIVRTDTLEHPDIGMAWRAGLSWRAQEHDIRCRLVGWTPPEEVQLEAISGGLTCGLTAKLTALSRNSTRLWVATTLRASTFRDRLLLQSLHLGKAKLSRKFETVVSGYAQDAARRAAA